MKPKKKEIPALNPYHPESLGAGVYEYNVGYNQALSDYEEWLRSEECLKMVVVLLMRMAMENLTAGEQAKAILSVLSGEGEK